MPRYSRSLCLFALILAALAARPSAADKRPITEKDLFKFVWVADPQITPDGSLVAFVRVTVDEKKDQYETSLWLAKTDGSEPPRPLTSGIRDGSPRWAPDGRRLAFTRSVEKDGRPQPPQIFVMTLAGGEPRPLTDIPRGAANPDWSPDGTTLAFSSACATRGDRDQGEAAGPPERQARREAARIRRPGRSPRRSIARTAYPAPDSSIPIGRRRSGRLRSSTARAAARRSGSRRASSRPAITAGRRTARRSSSLPIGGVSRYYYPNDSDLFAVLEGRRRTEVARQHRGHDWRVHAVAGRQASRVRRHPARQRRSDRSANRICGSSICPAARRAT